MPEGFDRDRSSDLPNFVEFREATFRAGAGEAQRPRHDTGLLGSVVDRPMVFRRNDASVVSHAKVYS